MKRASNKSKRIAKPAPLAQQLDKAVDKIMSDRESKLPRVNSRIAAILRIASELRDLPSEDFKARLKKDLVARVTPLAPCSEEGELHSGGFSYCECLPGGARCAARDRILQSRLSARPS